MVSRTQYAKADANKALKAVLTSAVLCILNCT